MKLFYILIKLYEKRKMITVTELLRLCMFVMSQVFLGSIWNQAGMHSLRLCSGEGQRKVQHRTCINACCKVHARTQQNTHAAHTHTLVNKSILKCHVVVVTLHEGPAKTESPNTGLQWHKLNEFLFSSTEEECCVRAGRHPLPPTPLSNMWLLSPSSTHTHTQTHANVRTYEVESRLRKFFSCKIGGVGQDALVLQR